MAAGSKLVQSEENLTKTRQGGLRNKTRSSLRQTRSTNGGEWDLVRLCEGWLARRPRRIRNSGPLYLEIVSSPSTGVGWPNREWVSIELAK